MSQGKYQGKRLSATEVNRLYAAGERDFRGAVLRGSNFRGFNLSGADFSGTDIKGARFCTATLEEVDFSRTQGGVQTMYFLFQLLLIFHFSAFFGSISMTGKELYKSRFIVPDYIYWNGSTINSIIIFTGVCIVFVILSRGFPKQLSLLVSIAGVVIGALLVNFLGVNRSLESFLFLTIAFMFLSSCPSPIASSLPLGLIAVSSVLAGIALIQAVGITFAVIVFTKLSASLEAFVDLGDELGLIAFVITILIVYVLRCTYVGVDNSLWISMPVKAFSSGYGTSFRGSNLSKAIFTQANLRYSSFADIDRVKTNLTQVRLKDAKGLELTHLGTTILQDSRALNLLTALNGNGQDLTYTDLHGANLSGVKLHKANLKGANLSGAMLHHAELQLATLTETNCVGTNFTAAQLTGACLEAWNYDDTTIFQSINCQYVFLKEEPNALGWRERLPHNPDKCFAPGDFERYFREVLDEVRLLIRGGVDPQAFKTAFQSLMENHGIAPGDVRSISRRDGDVLIDVAIPAGAAKPDVARTFDSAYEKALPAAAAQALLEAERRSKQDLIQLANKSIDSISSVLSNLTIHNTAMNHSQNPNVSTGDRSFYTGGDVNLTGSTINLGEISGQVSNQISQIPELPTRDQPSLRDILTQLQTAAETDSELNDDEKAEALQAVARIAAAGTDPAPSPKTQGLVKRATATLKGMTETLTDASKLADACTKLLPLVLSLFALV